MAALSDLRVLELATHVAGPYCGKLFATFGADVVKIEPPGDGDESRGLGPFPDSGPDRESSGLFLYLNTGKRSVTVDLESADGRDVFRRLLKTADVVVESFPPGTMERLGLGFESLEELRPGVVLTSITNFGQTGPWKDYQATDVVHYAASGMASVNGMPEREPLKHPGYQSYLQAGAVAFAGSMTAICHRDVAGLGQHVDVSVLEAGATVFAPQLTAYSYTGQSRGRAGGRVPSSTSASSGLLRCKDGYIALSPRSDESWHGIWRFLGDAEVADDPRFATQADRRKNITELEGLLEPYLAEHTLEELFREMGPLRVLVGMTLDIPALVSDPHLAEREFFSTVRHPVAGDTVMPGAPFKMSDTPGDGAGPAPLLGEHTSELLSEIGLSEEEVTDLQRAGVI